MKNKPSKGATDIHSQLDLLPGQSIDLLKALHILTREGKLNQDSRRKLKQVRHLIQLIEPLLQEAQSSLPASPKNTDASSSPSTEKPSTARPSSAASSPTTPSANASLSNAASSASPSATKPASTTDALTIVDHGAGKSYLGFMLYDALQGRMGRPLHIHGIENREELVQRSAQLAQQCNFSGMQFHALNTQDALNSPDLPKHIDLVTALHACNTATDDAITFGLMRRCDAFALVPCCQAEVAATLRTSKQQMLSQTPLSELWRHPIHTRELGSQLTNVLRCLRLEASGYDVTVTELVGWEHAMKNELIIARRTGKPKRSAQVRQGEILSTFGLESLLERFAPVV